MQFCTTMIRVYIFPLCYIIVSVDTYIVLTCHSSCCDSFNNLLAKRIRQWPNWPGLDISAYFSVCVPVQLQKITSKMNFANNRLTFVTTKEFVG